MAFDALTYAGHRANLKPLEDSERFEFIKGDLRSPTEIQQALEKTRPDAIIHFAAESHVDNSISGPLPFIETNIVGTFNLLEAARRYWLSLEGEHRQNFRFVHVSTDEVFGSLGAEGHFTESTPYDPRSPYSSSKAASDHLVNAWHHTYRLPTLITNCSNNYGPYQFPEKLIPRMITHALAGQPLPVYGRGLNVRDWIHVEDHSHGVWLALTRGNPGESYCFGGRSERANIDVVKSICTLMDEMNPRADGKPHSSLIAFVEDRQGHDFRYAIDDGKAQKALGFERKYADFETGLRATVSWYLANKTWTDEISRRIR